MNSLKTICLISVILLKIDYKYPKIPWSLIEYLKEYKDLFDPKKRYISQQAWIINEKYPECYPLFYKQNKRYILKNCKITNLDPEKIPEFNKDKYIYFCKRLVKYGNIEIIDKYMKEYKINYTFLYDFSKKYQLHDLTEHLIDNYGSFLNRKYYYFTNYLDII